MSGSSLAEARLAGVFAESITYGIYLVTCFSCWGTLLGPADRPGRIKWVMLLVAAALFVIATLHLALNYYRIIVAFAFAEGPGDSIMALYDIASWDNVMSSVLVVLQCTIGDAIPIYRCYIVYERSWKVIIPSILLYLGGCCCTGYFIYLQAILQVDLINIKKLVPLGTAFWAVTIALNIINTSLLVHRIWHVNHRVQVGKPGPVASFPNQSATNRLHAVMKIIAASGFLYTFTALVTFIAEVRGSVVGYPLNDIAVVIVGIAFNLIITRSSQVFQEKQTTRTSVSASFPLHSLPKRHTFVSNSTFEMIQPVGSTRSFSLSQSGTDTLSRITVENGYETLSSPTSDSDMTLVV